MLSNVVDIEALIALTETQASETGLDFLTTIDLPLADARQGLDELRHMGITHASLFPGVDGVCLELADRFFARRW